MNRAQLFSAVSRRTDTLRVRRRLAWQGGALCGFGVGWFCAMMFAALTR